VDEHDPLHEGILLWNKVGVISHNGADFCCHKALLCSRRMEPEPRPTFSLAAAGTVLIGTTAAVIVAASLVGWLLGSFAYGFLAGVVVGIPAGIVTVIRRYGNAF